SHINKTHGISAAIACSECHTYPSTVNQSGHLGSALPAEVPLSGPRATAQSHTPVYSNDANRTCSNTYCHETVTPNWNATVLNGTFADCTKCHAIPPATPTHTGYSVTDFPGLSVCAGCHTAVLASPTDYSHVFTNPALHIDGIISVDCIGCHRTVQGSRAAVVGQFASQSHHIQGAELPLTKADCYKCHWEADINGDPVPAYHSQTSGKGVSLVIWNGATRPTVATPGTTYISYTANGSRAQISKLNAVCLGCHNSANIPAANLFGTFASDQYSPEPRMVPALAKTSILSRYSSTTTVLWSNYAFTNSSGQIKQYGTNGKKQVTKALSAHGNAIKNQFPAWSATTGEDETMADVATATAKTDTRRNVFCYDCHNSHGSDASGITSSYSSATGRYKGGLLKST